MCASRHGRRQRRHCRTLFGMAAFLRRMRAAALVPAIALLVLAAALPTRAVAAAPTQNGPSDTTAGVCDQYAGDPDPGTPEWTARDVNNVTCDYQRKTDAQSNPAYLAKLAEQSAVAAAEFATVTAPEWAAEP